MLDVLLWGALGLSVLTVAGVWGWIDTQPAENDYGER